MESYKDRCKDRTPYCSNGADSAGITDKICLIDGLVMELDGFTNRQLLEYYLKSRDPDAYEEFTKRVRACIRGAAARRLLQSHLDATQELLEDFEQKVHVKLVENDCEKLRKFRWPDDDAIYRFLKVVSVRVTLDWIDKNKNEPDPIVDIDPPSPAPVRDAEILRAQIDKCLFRILAGELNFKRDRAIYWLFYRDGYTSGQIAKLVNLSAKDVGNILQRLNRKVRSLLRTDPNDPKNGGHNGQ